MDDARQKGQAIVAQRARPRLAFERMAQRSAVADIDDRNGRQIGHS